ncbi:hypothetical protein AK812_SmicGene47385, partial [Symbiodinium microadriaticum]
QCHMRRGLAGPHSAVSGWRCIALSGRGPKRAAELPQSGRAIFV